MIILIFFFIGLFKCIELLYKIINVKYDPDRSIFLAKIHAKIIEKKIYKKKIDFLFTNDTTLISYLKTDVPIILWTDLTFRLFKNTYFREYNKFSKLSSLNGELLEKKALDKCYKIIYSSQYAIKSAIKHYKVNKNKIFYLPFSADINFVNKRKSVKQIPHNKECYRFLTIGVDWHRKGIDKTIKFIQKLNSDKSIYAKLDVVGVKNTSEKKYDNIKFHGYLSKKYKSSLNKLKNLYEKADFFILLSRNEALGIVFLEAAYYGLPIIASCVGGIKSVVKNNGIFFYNNESFNTQFNRFRKLLKSSNYKKYSKYSLIQYQKNSWEENSKKIKKIIV